MFSKYLQERDHDLYAKAIEAGIPIDILEGVYAQSADTAVKSLRDLVRMRAKAEPIKTDHVAMFREKYAKEIAAASKAVDKLFLCVNEYTKKYQVRIVIDFDAEPDEFIRLGRAPRGSKVIPPRDLSILYKYLIQFGIPNELRVFPNNVLGADPDYMEVGYLQEDGTIKANGKIFKYPKHWVTDVFKRAMNEGGRDTPVGSPHKAIKIQNKRGQWGTIDRLWNEASAWYQDELAEEEDEDDLEDYEG